MMYGADFLTMTRAQLDIKPITHHLNLTLIRVQQFGLCMNLKEGHARIVLNTLPLAYNETLLRILRHRTSFATYSVSGG